MKSYCFFMANLFFLFGSIFLCSGALAQEIPSQEIQQKAAQELKGHIEDLLQKGFAHREQIRSGQMLITHNTASWSRSGNKSSAMQEIILAFDEKRRRVDRRNTYSPRNIYEDVGCIGCYKKNNRLILKYSNYFLGKKEENTDDVVSQTAVTIYDEKQLEENILTKVWTIYYGFIPQYIVYFSGDCFPTKERIENAKSYLLLNTVGLMDSDRTKVNIAKEEYKGTLCKKITLDFKGTDGSSISTTLWIAKEQGYALRKHFLQGRSKDVHYDELLETDVTLDKGSGIWFPSAWHYERNNDGKPYISQDGTIKDTVLNKPLPEELFDMKDIKILPAGVLVHWTAEQVPPPYSGRLYWDGNDVVSREMYSTNLVEQNRKGGRFRRLFFVNVSVLALIAAWHLWRKYQQLKRQN